MDIFKLQTETLTYVFLGNYLISPIPLFIPKEKTAEKLKKNREKIAK